MVPERREVKALAEHILRRAGREDIKLSVAYILNFRLDDEISLNVLVDPTENYSRSAMTKMVNQAVARLDEAEDERELGESAKKGGGSMSVAEAVQQALQSSPDAGPTLPQISGTSDQPSNAQDVGPGTPDNLGTGPVIL